MPSCFSLTHKHSGIQAHLQEVDKELWEMFNDGEVDPENWYMNWYNTVGLSLAIGHRWDKIREFFPTLEPVITHLETNYDVDSWKEWK